MTEEEKLRIRKKLEEKQSKRRAILGKFGCDSNHFGEEYVVNFTDGTYVLVYVWTEHGVNERDQHEKAEKIAEDNFPELEIDEVLYA
jgi:hypothetical protein